MGRAGALLAASALLCVAGCTSTESPSAPGTEASAGSSAPSPSTSAASVWDGVVVVLDPGHRLGNSRFASSVNAPVPDGAGSTKACNTVGASTNSGYPESSFTWSVASMVRRELRALGARVVLTRESNSESEWGPCVDERGQKGNSLASGSGSASDSATVLKLSIHADGGPESAAGFHLITAPGQSQSAESLALAKALKRSLSASFPVATYIAGGDGLDSRRDLATLNHSRIPTVMVELGNMRNPADARRMTTARGRSSYAKALVAGLLEWLSR
ncbi:N-acetylmuramoyl-L-alanine amidase [Nocardioides daedukensis]|uniref:N-acetylmuramoyl-L-alanine amidase n=1 Tax=Nocardioides daedukensis TaxID=634462 RepID=A0A7Y9S2I9_9ACTN|nr:N-acetylmuramoyl-L-alanine amidase [Nocardioides daedukensis]NYG59824.1 N-acetylmuramoyl-L-alanine amidase [Nocardioides daedukensis]